MNDTQLAHLDMILTTSRKLLEDKYIRGALEHQSNLGEDYSVEQLVDMAIEEALDQVTYLLTLKNKLETTGKTETDMV